MTNECTLHAGPELIERIRLVYEVMQQSVARGLSREGKLPGSPGLNRRALRGDGSHFVSPDNVIATMREVGLHLDAGYRETTLRGLVKYALTC